MKTFTTNYGNDIEATNVAEAVQKLIENYILLLGERLGCRMKVDEKKSFTSPRMKGTGVRLIAVPDLPDFVTRHMREIPETEHSFLVSESAPGGETWEVENLHPESLRYLYKGVSWEEVASTHCYFIAGCGAVRDGRDPAALFVNSFRINSPGHAWGQIISKSPPAAMTNHGTVHAKGKLISN